MGIKKAGIILFIVYPYSFSLFSQNVSTNLNKENAEYSYLKNNANHPCITAEEYLILEKQSNENIKLLRLDKNQNKNNVATLLNWPIKAASDFNDCDYYFIGAYVDQNTLAGTYQDFDCGSNTYDGHRGTDIAIWPYGFFKMDNNQVEVIASAPGTIIQKADGNFDRNCSSNNLTANSIIIQHADGSQALYWHMKKNSLTVKTVGQTVVAGEYLGVVGSSGSASGPHLHFEVWASNTNSTYNDPYAGTCNTLNTSSWWTMQKPHTNSAVIKVSVNTTDLVLPGCPVTETPNEADTFAIPFQGPGLSPGYAKFYIFIRDDVTGLTANCKILNPNNSVFNSWIYTSSSDSKTRIQGYSKLLPTIPGKYIFQATYNGMTCSKDFYITQSTGIFTDYSLLDLQIIQNPSGGSSITISSQNMENGACRITVTNIVGQIALTVNETIIGNSFHENISIAGLSSGSYFITVDTEKSRIVKKIILQN